MGALGVVLGVFLVFSIVVSWAGGDREKAFLEDTIMESRRAQTQMAAEADRAKNESYVQDERIKELQGRLGDSLIENNRLERAVAPEERDKREAAGELQGRPGETLIDNNRLERAPAPEERDVREAAGENKPANALWDTRAADPADGQDNGDDDDDNKDPRLKAAEGSLRRESSARAEAEKKLAIETRALSYLETELNETLMEVRQDWRGMPVAGAALCPWDPGKR